MTNPPNQSQTAGQNEAQDETQPDATEHNPHDGTARLRQELRAWAARAEQEASQRLAVIARSGGRLWPGLAWPRGVTPAQREATRAWLRERAQRREAVQRERHAERRDAAQ